MLLEHKAIFRLIYKCLVYLGKKKKNKTAQLIATVCPHDVK